MTEKLKLKTFAVDNNTIALLDRYGETHGLSRSASLRYVVHTFCKQEVKHETQ